MRYPPELRERLLSVPICSNLAPYFRRRQNCTVAVPLNESNSTASGVNRSLQRRRRFLLWFDEHDLHLSHSPIRHRTLQDHELLCAVIDRCNKGVIPEFRSSYIFDLPIERAIAASGIVTNSFGEVDDGRCRTPYPNSQVRRRKQLRRAFDPRRLITEWARK